MKKWIKPEIIDLSAVLTQDYLNATGYDSYGEHCKDTQTGEIIPLGSYCC